MIFQIKFHDMTVSLWHPFSQIAIKGYSVLSIGILFKTFIIESLTKFKSQRSIAILCGTGLYGMGCQLIVTGCCLKTTHRQQTAASQ
jgi:hypothetical protein